MPTLVRISFAAFVSGCSFGGSSPISANPSGRRARPLTLPPAIGSSVPMRGRRRRPVGEHISHHSLDRCALLVPRPWSRPC